VENTRLGSGTVNGFPAGMLVAFVPESRIAIDRIPHIEQKFSREVF
jgi:hypothetical protein